MGGTPKWMVFVRENAIKVDDLEIPPFVETCKYIHDAPMVF